MLKANILVPLRSFTLEVDLEVGNEILVLVGPSGSGKTTILKCIAGLKTPRQGRIQINEHVLYSEEPRVNLPPRQRRVGYVFQEYALFPHLTVKRNVQYGLSREHKKQNPRAAEEILERMGILQLQDRYPQLISGGERQRVALARALVTEPEIMLLDEPLSALDQEIRSELQQELKKLQRQWKIPFLLVTHDPVEAKFLGDQIIRIDQGTIQRIDKPQTKF